MINSKLLLSQDCLLAFQEGYEFVGGGLFGVLGFLAGQVLHGARFICTCGCSLSLKQNMFLHKS